MVILNYSHEQLSINYSMHSIVSYCKSEKILVKR